MITTLLDTGPVVAFLRAEDPRHANCLNAISQVSTKGRVVTLREVVSEAYTLIRMRFSSTNGAGEVLSWARTLHHLAPEPRDHDRAEALLLGHRDLKLSYVDALIMAVGEHYKVDTILTTDHELAATRLDSPIEIVVIPAI